MSDSCGLYRVVILEFRWLLVIGGKNACLHFHWPVDSVCASSPLLFVSASKIPPLRMCLRVLPASSFSVGGLQMRFRPGRVLPWAIRVSLTLWWGFVSHLRFAIPSYIFEAQAATIVFCLGYRRKQENGRRLEKSFTGGILKDCSIILHSCAARNIPICFLSIFVSFALYKSILL